MPPYKNKKWLKNEYINKKNTMAKIAIICNVCYNTIRYFIKKYNIPIRSNSEAQHLRQANHCSLSKKATEWINGELLGDGSLASQSKYSARFVYSSKHKEYAQYISDTLRSFGIEQAGKIYKQEDKRYGSFSYKYKSLSYIELLPIRKKWYPNGKKIVPKNIDLTPLMLRQEYIGDGCLVHRKNRSSYIKFCTEGFTIPDVEFLCHQINKLKIKAVTFRRRSSKNIRISSYSVKDFLNYVGSCPVECYKYKWEY